MTISSRRADHPEFTNGGPGDPALSPERRDTDAEIRSIDVADRREGCSALGTLRDAGRVRIAEAGGKRRLAPVDLKDAVDAVAPAFPGAEMPRDAAERVVAGARVQSPNLDERRLAVRRLGTPAGPRDLRPRDLELAVDQFGRSGAVRAAHSRADVVGQAHGRRMKAPTAPARRSEATSNGAGADVPSWPWSRVVARADRPAVGDREQCRRPASDGAA